MIKKVGDVNYSSPIVSLFEISLRYTERSLFLPIDKIYAYPLKHTGPTCYVLRGHRVSRIETRSPELTRAITGHTNHTSRRARQGDSISTRFYHFE